MTLQEFDELTLPQVKEAHDTLCTNLTKIWGHTVHVTIMCIPLEKDSFPAGFIITDSFEADPENLKQVGYAYLEIARERKLQ
jgi:formate dehydrogenase assembly factor FdhD